MKADQPFDARVTQVEGFRDLLRRNIRLRQDHVPKHDDAVIDATLAAVRGAVKEIA